jgi:hypothetical protein
MGGRCGNDDGDRAGRVRHRPEAMLRLAEITRPAIADGESPA